MRTRGGARGRHEGGEDEHSGSRSLLEKSAESQSRSPTPRLTTGDFADKHKEFYDKTPWRAGGSVRHNAVSSEREASKQDTRTHSALSVAAFRRGHGALLRAARGPGPPTPPCLQRGPPESSWPLRAAAAAAARRSPCQTARPLACCYRPLARRAAGRRRGCRRAGPPRLRCEYQGGSIHSKACRVSWSAA